MDTVETSLAQEEVSQFRPWLRFFARTLDFIFYVCVLGVIIGIYFPEHLPLFDNSAFGILLMLTYVFIEPALYGLFKTTPSKWFFSIQLVSASGQNLTYSSTLARSFKAYWYGWGCGLPIVYLFTLYFSHSYFEKNQITRWDKEEGFITVHHKIRVLRILTLSVIAISLISLMIYGYSLPD